jgi:hypothetical protein
VTLTVNLPEDLVARLTAVAAGRGVSVEVVVADLIARLPPQPAGGAAAGDALAAFIGCGASGRTEPFDIHAARAELAARKLAEGA